MPTVGSGVSLFSLTCFVSIGSAFPDEIMKGVLLSGGLSTSLPICISFDSVTPCQVAT